MRAQEGLVMDAKPEALKACQVVVVCVESGDTGRCMALLQSQRPKGPAQQQPLGVISLQKGVKNSSQISDG